MARWIFIGLFLAYYIVMAVSSYLSYDKLVAAVLAGRVPRARVYLGQVAGLALPSAALLALAAFGIFSFEELGLSWLKISSNIGLVIPATVIYAAYLVYLLFSLVSMRRNAVQGNFKQIVSDRMRALYPATSKEKRVWFAVAICVGITEELLFRGLLIGAVRGLLPALPVVVILSIATLLFAAGHLYQGLRQAVWPALLGLLYGVFFIAFGSILPVILTHSLQDIKVLWALPVAPEPSAGDISPPVHPSKS